MYSLIAISFIVSLLARGDFLGLLISIYIFVLFIYQANFTTLDHLKSYLKINLAAILYDVMWLIFHFSGYWSGNEYEHAEISLKKWTYFFSFVSFLVKVALLVSVYISYDKGVNRKNTKQSSVKVRGQLGASVGKFNV
jgi:hypothetical protein